MKSQILFFVIHETVIMTLAVLGNIFLLFVILRGNFVTRRRISPVQLLLIHNCVADLLFALLSLGTEILTLLTYPNFQGPDWLCRFMRYSQMFPMYASPFLLVAISADRYQAICRPLAHFRASRYRRPNWLAALAWGLALLFSVPQLFIWGKKKDTGECVTVYGREKHVLKNVYVISFNTVAWLLPSICAASFYYCVCKAVWMSSAKNPIGNVCQDGSLQHFDEPQSAITKDYIKKLRKKSNGFRRQDSEFDRKRVQTVRLTLTIIACNFFLWMPFCVVNVLEAVWPTLMSSKASTYVMILGNLNSCVNPWIYILFNRSHVLKAFCGKRRVPCNDLSTRMSFNRTDTEASSSFYYGRNSSTKLSSVELSRIGGNLMRRGQRNVSFQCNSKYRPTSTLNKPAILLRNRSEASILLNAIQEPRCIRNSLTPTSMADPDRRQSLGLPSR